MKTHAIIPIFIPHQGCPHDCVFCNQRKITAHSAPPAPEDVAKTMDTWLSTLGDVPHVEVAFYGGSFTAIPMADQQAYLSIARTYKERGLVQRIHLSTRPDCIDPSILDNLREYGVDVIELGVQSFDEEVLRLSGRGHDASCVYQASTLIRSYGFELGIQLMIGLPGDSLETCLNSARETVKIAPAIARLYPTIVIRDTRLYDMCAAGTYTALSLPEAVERTAAMYRILTAAGINVIRVGLKSSDILTEKGATLGDTFHPAFRQLVEGQIAQEDICAQLDKILPHTTAGAPTAGAYAPTESSRPIKPPLSSGAPVVLCSANPHSFSNLIGHKSCNRRFFAGRYPNALFRFQPSPALPEGTYQAEVIVP